MEPTAFDEENLVLGPPPGMTEKEVISLSVHKAQFPVPQVISCWKLTKEELEEINRTGKVWLTIFGQSMPPVWLSVASPFEKAPDGDQSGGR